MVVEATMSMIDAHHLTEVHQCFSCELRFQWQTELAHHVRTEHPEVHVAYVSRHEQQVLPQRGSET
jgi:hypothetical protein